MKESTQTHWIPLSDLMTGMMLIFMVVALIFMMKLQVVATDLRDVKGKMYQALDQEFSQDFKKWDAELLKDLTIRFKNPTVLFQQNRYQLTPEFKSMLRDFVPRYISIISDPRFESSVKEILIESHTSPEFDNLNADKDIKNLHVSDRVKEYLHNMDLAEDRGWFTIAEVFEIMGHSGYEDMMIKKMHLHDMASSTPLYNKDGNIDMVASRRVEFHILMNSEERLEEIAQKLSPK